MKGLYELRRSWRWRNHLSDSQQPLLHPNFSPSTMSRYIRKISQKSFYVSVKLFNVIVALAAFGLLVWSGVGHDQAQHGLAL